MKKVAVAMSGGVDSSVASVLLKEQGFNVIGITLRFFDSGDEIKCCGADYSLNMARKVCDILGIKHYLKDARAYFSKYVIEDFKNSYLTGKTPNPCIECNRWLKFDYLFKLAKAMGADYLATGHYARILNQNGNTFLLRGIDEKKDQSYFLYCLNRNIMKNILFPLGEKTKEEVRRIAKAYNLPVSKEKESKDICFIPGDYSLWLKRNAQIETKQGYIKDIEGKIVGRHNGYFNFTIGQRKNLGISFGKRMYVVDIIPEKNEVIVGELKDAYFSGCYVVNLNWLVEPFSVEKCFVQIRYKHNPVECFLGYKDKDTIKVIFNEKQFAVAKGQSAVFYSGEMVLGGGIIKDVIK